MKHMPTAFGWKMLFLIFFSLPSPRLCIGNQSSLQELQINGRSLFWTVKEQAFRELERRAYISKYEAIASTLSDVPTAPAPPAAVTVDNISSSSSANTSTKTAYAYRFVFVGGMHQSGTSIMEALLSSQSQVRGLRPKIAGKTLHLSDTNHCQRVVTSLKGSKGAYCKAPEDEGCFLTKAFSYLPGRSECSASNPSEFSRCPLMHLNGSWPLDIPYDAVRKLLWYDWSKFWFSDPQYRAPPPSRLANTVEGKIATRHPSVKILVEKTPTDVVRAGFLQAVFSPDASHFLFVLRHPVLRCGPNLMRGCGVQLSGTGGSHVTEKMFAAWIAAHRLMEKDLHILRHYLVMQHEWLLVDPKAATDAMAQLIGLPRVNYLMAAPNTPVAMSSPSRTNETKGGKRAKAPVPKNETKKENRAKLPVLNKSDKTTRKQPSRFQHIHGSTVRTQQGLTKKVGKRRRRLGLHATNDPRIADWDMPVTLSVPDSATFESKAAIFHSGVLPTIRPDDRQIVEEELNHFGYTLHQLNPLLPEDTDTEHTVRSSVTSATRTDLRFFVKGLRPLWSSS